jgi:hypothetical protein
MIGTGRHPGPAEYPEANSYLSPSLPRKGLVPQRGIAGIFATH